jgi:hypothetical protein
MADVLYKQDGSKVRNINLTDDESIPLMAQLKSKFDWINQEEYRAVAEPYFHEYLEANVIRTCVIIKVAEVLLGKSLATAHRLFDLDSNTSMLYATSLFQEEQPAWAPPNAFILGVTEHYEEYSHAINPKMLDFKEYFFVAPPETLIELGVDQTDINNDTVYSALVSNNEVKAIRRYTNFVENDPGILANWQLLYIIFAKKARRLDLIRDLLSKPFVEAQ